MKTDGWKTVALDEVATIERDAIQPEAIRKGTAYLGLEHIESGGKILCAKPVHEGELASSKFKFTDRHVLYGKLRPYLAKIACPDFAGICSTDILPILPGPNLERRFLCYFLRQPSMVDYASSRAAGANLPRLSPTALAGIEIPLPPLAEQRRIAEVLDRAEALRAKRRAALTQLDSLTQSLFLDLFGDPRRKGSTGSTPTKPRLLGDLTRIRTGKLDANAADEDGAHPFFTCAIEPLRINTPSFDCKAVLVAGNGDLNVKYFEGKFNAYQRTYVIESLDESVLVPRFLYAFLDLYVSELRKQAIGGVIKYIKLPYLTDAVVQLPSEECQRNFARQVTAVEALKTLHRAALAELDALFASLQQRAFSGQL
jgi:type I restriction enzyme S subunit